MGGHACHNVAQLQFVADGAGRADADDIFHAKEAVKFIAVNADGGNAHAACHYGYRYAFVCAGVALNTTYIVYKYRVFQECFRNEFRAQGIAGHQHGFCECAFFGCNMSSCHRYRRPFCFS